MRLLETHGRSLMPLLRCLAVLLIHATQIEGSGAGVGSGGRFDRAHSRDAQIIQALELETAEQKLEIETLERDVEASKKSTSLTRQQDQRTILSLTEDLNAFQDMNLEKEQEIQQLRAKLQESHQSLINLEDLNDELRVKQNTAGTGQSRRTSQSLADELNPGDGDFDSEPEEDMMPQLLAKIRQLEDEKASLERHLREHGMLEDEINEFNQLNLELRGLNASFQRERAETTRVHAENQALRELYKDLQLKHLKHVREFSHTKLQEEYKQLKSNYEDVKEYAEEMEMTKRTLKLRINTLEVELSGLRDDYTSQVDTPQKSSAPSNIGVQLMKSPRATIEGAGFQRTIQTVIDVQQAKVEESEASKKLIQWKLTNATKELARQNDINAQLSGKLAASELLVSAAKQPDAEDNSHLVAEIQDISLEGHRTRTALLKKSKMEIKTKLAVRRANERIMSLESELHMMTGENQDLSAKVARLQSRLQKLKGGHEQEKSNSIIGGAVANLDR